jgi:3-phenylpropionate/cinnamic acid dioxygenase small subunit
MARDDGAVTISLRHELEQVLIDEYWLLDNSQFEDWLALMTDDIRYWAPVRENLGRDEENFYQADLLTHFDEDRTTMGLRVARLRTGYAHAEEPPSRQRHLVSNVKLLDGSDDRHSKVASNFIVFRSRPGIEEHLFVGSRRDQWRQVDSNWRLCERLIIFDHDIIENITVFV